ncbi:MAG TPA: hypothetical protein VF676_06300 [Flavobacterium sp.]|jgi:hypothetical protein
MKNTLLKIYIFSFFLLSDFIAFAQLPVDDEDGELQDDDPVVPINGKLIWLAVAGILFAIYTYRKRAHTQTK